MDMEMGGESCVVHDEALGFGGASLSSPLLIDIALLVGAISLNLN